MTWAVAVLKMVRRRMIPKYFIFSYFDPKLYLYWSIGLLQF
jgi:hypothetical protein